MSKVGIKGGENALPECLFNACPFCFVLSAFGVEVKKNRKPIYVKFSCPVSVVRE